MLVYKTHKLIMNDERPVESLKKGITFMMQIFLNCKKEDFKT